MRIDSHQYFTPQHPPEHLRPILTRNRFDGSIAIDAEVAGVDHEFVKGVVRRVDLDDPGLGAALDEWQREARFRGVLYRLGESLPVAGLGEVARRGIPLDLELDSGQLPMIAAALDAAPELRIAIDDLANPPFGDARADAWARALEQAAESPRVFCKASNLVAHAPQPWNVAAIRPFVRHALAVFGPSRLMFGSGWPAYQPAAGWKETLAAFTQSIGAQTIETREELLGGTAARFYGLVTMERASTDSR